MWPLSIVLLLTTAAPQQNTPSREGAYVGKIPAVASVLQHNLQSRKVAPQELANSNLCFAIRSYHFRRQDGNAPVLVGTTTCTPSRILEQKRVSPTRGLYVPLALPSLDLRSNDQQQPQ
jgi:hypothetical protein